MYQSKLDIREFGGRKYVAKRPPQSGWPCTHCDLAPACGKREYFEASDFPSCRGAKGKLGYVVFSLYHEPHKRKENNL